jgi:hypothetical protein
MCALTEHALDAIAQIEKYSPDSNAWTGVATAFLVGDGARVVTAGHVLNAGSINHHACRIGHQRIPFDLQEPIRSSAIAADVAVWPLLQRDILLIRCPLALAPVDEGSLLGKEVTIVGFSSMRDPGPYVTRTTIANVNNGVFVLQGGNPGAGFSGSPVLLEENNMAVGVVSGRDQSSGFCYATSVNVLLRLYPEVGNQRPCLPNFQSALVIPAGALREHELFSLLDEWKQKYRTDGNPGELLAQVLPTLRVLRAGRSGESYQLAQAEAFSAYLAINAQRDDASLNGAREWLSFAIDGIHDLRHFDEDVLRSQVRMTWLTAISLRQQGNLAAALTTCEEALRHLEGRAPDIRIPILREVAVITQESVAFDRLESGVEDYRFNQIEVFHTYRRLFEHSLRLGDIRRAKRILRPLEQAFHATARSVDPIYRLTLWKDLYAFHAFSGNTRKAATYFTKAATGTKRLGLFGQQASLFALQREITNGELPRSFDTTPST